MMCGVDHKVQDHPTNVLCETCGNKQKRIIQALDDKLLLFISALATVFSDDEVTCNVYLVCKQ